MLLSVRVRCGEGRHPLWRLKARRGLDASWRPRHWNAAVEPRLAAQARPACLEAARGIGDSPAPGGAVGVVFGDHWPIGGSRANMLDQPREPPMRTTQQSNRRAGQGRAAFHRLAEDFLHPLSHTRQRGEVHHRGGATDGVRAPIRFFQRFSITGRLLQAIQVGLDLRQIRSHLIQETIEDG